MSRHVSVCLMDSVTGDISYNSANKIVGFIDFFKPEFDSEGGRIKKRALERFKLRDYVVFSDVLEETKERAIVNKAFYDLEKRVRKERGY